ncbi:GM21144 [Drosophila sechellia]|uniref:GM21144 n=1 Tax=Drosophila sechellia TaxID=7238 RepID=B4HT28_DROSE|nr:GM21144 [Drosophila sechellia]
MNSPLAITALVWGILCLTCPPSTEAGREDWTPGQRLVYENLAQQDCGVLSNQIPARTIRLMITGGRKSSSTSDCTTYDNQRVCAPPVEEFTIDKWILHEEFNLFYPGYDIALIKLNRKVFFKDHIRPICLPLTDELLEFTLQMAQTYKAVGWGKTESIRFANSTMEVYISTEKCTDGRDTSFLCANEDYVDDHAVRQGSNRTVCSKHHDIHRDGQTDGQRTDMTRASRLLIRMNNI